MAQTTSTSTAFDGARSAINNVSTGSSKKEGTITRRIEEQTAKVPSVGYLSLAVGSMVLSAGLAMFANRKEFANFVGLWAPSFMLIGIYNKLVKLEGSDRFSKAA